jgi:hypothetical protein
MIVRILAEGQFEVTEDQMDRLNELDGAVESAVEANDQGAFASALSALLEGVRNSGRPLADESLEDSDFILPPADATLEEVRELLTGADDGLIPG